MGKNSVAVAYMLSIRRRGCVTQECLHQYYNRPCVQRISCMTFKFNVESCCKGQKLM